MQLEIDYLSFIPAIFAALLSLYNWLQTRKPANIEPNPVVEYAIVSSSYEETDLLTIPLIFHNSGSFNGVITDVKIGFKVEGKVKFLDILGSARLSELNTDLLLNMSFEKYTQEGYLLTVPNFPINVLSGDSTSVVFIATSDHTQNLIPIDKDASWVIETHYVKNKVKRVEFDFKISQESYERSENVRWYKSLQLQ